MKKFTASSEIGPGCLISFMRFFAIVFFVVLLGSCKTTKFTQKIDRTTNDSTAVSNTETSKKNSTSIVSESTKDVSSNLTQTNDSSSQATSIKDKDTNTLITFGPTGGTYNEQTGDFTNVASISISQKEKELQTKLSYATRTLNKQNKAIENQQTTITRLTELYEHSQDSVNALNEKLKSSTIQKETPKDNWYWWLLVGACGMFGLIFIIKSYPATSWLLAWL